MEEFVHSQVSGKTERTFSTLFMELGAGATLSVITAWGATAPAKAISGKASKT